jgi:hypothetical protein
MRMQPGSRGAAVIDWRVQGRLGMLPVDVTFQSEFELNLLTGRVEKHRFVSKTVKWNMCRPRAGWYAAA